jgi:hypothetical protein
MMRVVFSVTITRHSHLVEVLSTSTEISLNSHCDLSSAHPTELICLHLVPQLAKDEG